MELVGNGRGRRLSNVHEKPDLFLTPCCVASLIFVPLFVIGGTLVLLAIAVAGEVADNIHPDGQRIEGA
jgi:hypothetical protein